MLLLRVCSCAKPCSPLSVARRLYTNAVGFNKSSDLTAAWNARELGMVKLEEFKLGLERMDEVLAATMFRVSVLVCASDTL